MPPFNFDVPINRSNTSSLKWDHFDKDVLPMWVADMDFGSPPAVLDALKNRVEHGVFGYTLPPKKLFEKIAERLEKKYDWSIKPNWVVWIPGLVTGLNVMCRAFGNAGDEVLTQIPIYPPFLSAPILSQRELLKTSIVLNSDRWEIDFAEMENKISNRTKVYLFCNPHNPTGRIFDRKELKKVAKIAEAKNLIICSDEIHCDLLLDEKKTHIPIASLDAKVADRTITLMSPSKTFNIAGLGCSFAIIKNPALRKQFRKAMAGIVPHVNALGYTAALAAYENGEEWLQQLLIYLRSNRDFVYGEINSIKGLSTTHVEATYLAWINASDTGIKDPFTFFKNAGVALSNGKEFGADGYLRLNFGCTKSLLNEAIQRIKTAIQNNF
jgi:cysteine-S-conjugate beta-lyase